VSDRQRTIVVIATGLGLAILANALNRLLAYPGGGWFAYSPNAGVRFPGARASIWREAGIWLGALVLWTGVALWLYRRPRTGI